jgi:hypothetical protein
MGKAARLSRQRLIEQGVDLSKPKAPSMKTKDTFTVEEVMRCLYSRPGEKGMLIITNDNTVGYFPLYFLKNTLEEHMIAAAMQAMHETERYCVCTQLVSGKFARYVIPFSDEQKSRDHKLLARTKISSVRPIPLALLAEAFLECFSFAKRKTAERPLLVGAEDLDSLARLST